MVRDLLAISLVDTIISGRSGKDFGSFNQNTLLKFMHSCQLKYSNRAVRLRYSIYEKSRKARLVREEKGL